MDEHLVEVARFAHEVNRAYCLLLGDTSQVAWDDAPEWQRESAVMGVKHIQDNPDTTPAESHAGWLETKVADGWTFGLVKDAEAKKHPCMLPYDKLPPTQRSKDLLFITAVRVGLDVPLI